MIDARAAVSNSEPWIELRCAVRGEPASECDFRQLRHHTKNLLQQILLRLEHAHELKATERGSRLVADLQRRILLSAQISEALFGITGFPASMAERLRVLGETTIRMLADATQAIRLDVTVAGGCPEPLRPLVLRVAHEFIGNAVKHGMHARLAGTIGVRLAAGTDGCTTLVVSDDGWGFQGSPNAGDGLTIASDLAASAGGTIRLVRTDATVAELALPSPRVQRGFRDQGAGSEFEITR